MTELSEIQAAVEVYNALDAEKVEVLRVIYDYLRDERSGFRAIKFNNDTSSLMNCWRRPESRQLAYDHYINCRSNTISKIEPGDPVS